MQLTAVAAGAVLGAWLRWGLALVFNTAAFPFGTLCVNLLGGLLMGMAVAYFATLGPQDTSRLFVMTGFLGGFTTFSAFSAESLLMLQRGQYWLASVHTLSHVLGALAMAALGFALMQALRR